MKAIVIAFPTLCESKSSASILCNGSPKPFGFKSKHVRFFWGQLLDVADAAISIYCLFGFQYHLFTFVRGSYKCAGLAELVNIAEVVKLSKLVELAEVVELVELVE